MESKAIFGSAPVQRLDSEIDLSETTPKAFAANDPKPRPRSPGWYHSVTNATLWEPGIFKRAPWNGLLALLGALISTACAAVVLLSSDGKFANEWPSSRKPVQPAVVLAVLTVITNALLVVAFQEAANIAWWLKMLKGGTIAESHRYWSCMSSILISVLSIRHLNRVAVACIATGLVTLSGPLLQKASEVSLRSITRPSNFSVAISSANFPQGYSGLYMTRAGTINALTPNFAQVVLQYTSRSDITVQNTTCHQTCKGTVTAPGFDVNCTTSPVPYNITAEPGKTFNVGFANVDFFGKGEFGNLITVSTMHKGSRAAVGNYTKTDCTLTIATVNYPVEVTGNKTITLLPRSNDANETREVHGGLYFESAGLGVFPSSLGGIAYAADNIFRSNISLYFTGIFAIEGEGPMSSKYLNFDDSDDMGTTNLTWADPTPDILDGIRELTFRGAVLLSNSSTMQEVQGTEFGVDTFYVTQYDYFAGALALVVLAIGSIIMLFSGWWELGRPVTMSPVEIAKAFGSPILDGQDSNAEVNGLLSVHGKKRVRYGVVASEESRDLPDMEEQVRNERLAVAVEERVRWPAKGKPYS